MTAAEWLTSDEMTEALAQIKREWEERERATALAKEREREYYRQKFADQEKAFAEMQTLCDDCWADAAGGKG